MNITGCSKIVSIKYIHIFYLKLYNHLIYVDVINFKINIPTYNNKLFIIKKIQDIKYKNVDMT